MKFGFNQGEGVPRGSSPRLEAVKAGISEAEKEFGYKLSDEIMADLRAVKEGTQPTHETAELKDDLSQIDIENVYEVAILACVRKEKDLDSGAKVTNLNPRAFVEKIMDLLGLPKEFAQRESIRNIIDKDSWDSV